MHPFDLCVRFARSDLRGSRTPFFRCISVMRKLFVQHLTPRCKEGKRTLWEAELSVLTLDILCVRARPPQGEYEPGEKVLLWSAKQGRWLYAVVKAINLHVLH